MISSDSLQDVLAGERDHFRWFHASNPQNPALDELARTYHLHELAIEDCRAPGTRAKIDDYGDTLFVVANALSFDPAHYECSFAEINFFLKEDLVISVCEGQDGIVDQVKAAFASDERLAHPGRLFHRILDGIVDRYLPVLDTMEERIEDLEEKAIDHTSSRLLSEIFSLKRSLIEFRRVAISMRDLMSQLLRRPEPWLQSESPYFRDVFDHVLRAIEFTESYRDILTGILEVHLTAAANRTNDIVKVMTVFTTVALPILLITGYYGMNFDELPLLHHPHGGYIASVLMALLALGMMYLFRRIGWY
jgi:magnesium transporter